MLGRCRQTLCRGLVSGLHQQQCLQLDVLGLQISRNYNDWRYASTPSRHIRRQRRRAGAVQKVIDKMNPGSSDASSPVPSAAAAAESSPTAAGSSSSSSGPVMSPLSAQVPRVSSSTAAAAAAPTAAAADKPKTWAPAWLDKLIDYPRRRREPPPQPGSASPLQKEAPDAAAVAAAASSDGKKEGEDGWEDLPNLKNMSLDQYHGMIKGEPGSEDIEQAPRPQRPPNLGPRSNYAQRLDMPRIRHARYEQQSNLISIMDAEDKLRIKNDTAGVLKDRSFLDRIARTAQADPGVVQDLIVQYNRRKEYIDLLADHREAGRTMPLPTDDIATSMLVSRLRLKKRQDELKAVLKARDPATCQLKAWASFTGLNRICPKTELHYRHCCGATFSGKRALGGKPAKKNKKKKGKRKEA